MDFNKSIYIIDDDAVYTIFFKMSIEKLYPTIQIISFLNGQDALMDLLSKVNK